VLRVIKLRFLLLGAMWINEYNVMLRVIRYVRVIMGISLRYLRLCVITYKGVEIVRNKG